MIYHDLRKQGKVDDEINIENVVLKIIEKRYVVTNRSLRKLLKGNRYPAVNDLDRPFLSDRCRPDGLLAQRWLFLRRQVWHLRLQSLFMSIVPVEEQGKLYLLTKRGIDSIAEFNWGALQPFSQVYYHKQTAPLRHVEHYVRLCKARIHKCHYR